MFNFRYNILAIYQVVLGLLNSFLLIRVFGVSSQADAYLMASNIAISLQFIQLMVVEQFMFFYNDLKVEDRQSAREFYNAAVTFSLLSGLLFYLCFTLSIHPIIRLFAFGIDGERYLLLRNVLHILFIGTIVDSANMINQRLLNAEMRFSVPYVIGSFQTLFTVLLLVYLTVTNNTDVKLIAVARTCGTWAAALAGFVVLGRMGFKFQFRFRHPVLKPFVKNSLAMKFGHNLHNFLFNPITNNILSVLPSGYVSYFYYAQRLQQIVSNVVVGPSYAVFQSRVSTHWSQQNIPEIKTNIRKFLPFAMIVFISSSILAFFLIPVALGVVGSRHLQSNDSQYIQFLFLALSIWQLVVLVESPFVAVGAASKKSGIFIVTNTLFIFTYFISSFILAKWVGIYAIPFGATIGQIVNLVFYASFCMALLRVNGFSHVTSALTGNYLFRKL